MSSPASNLLIVFLNQLTQDERGLVAFAGKDTEHIKRAIGIIACLPFQTFQDKRAKWRELGFVSRMIPFAYAYDSEIIAHVKDAIDNGSHPAMKKATRAMPKIRKTPRSVGISPQITKSVRALADARAVTLGEIGIRLLSNYHALIRGHALVFGRITVNKEDLEFLRNVDRYVSIDKCETLTHS